LKPYANLLAEMKSFIMPTEEWEAYDTEPPDDPDNWQDEAEE
jgi:hypothetical protein